MIRHLALFITLGLSLAYTIIRYVVFGPEHVAQIPAFLFNKAIAFSSVIYMLYAGYFYLTSEGSLSKFWGKATLGAAAIHCFLSFVLFSEAYFPLLYENGIEGKLNINGEWMLLCGALGLFLYYLLGRKRHVDFRTYRVYKIASTLLFAGHVYFLGAGGWLHPYGWYGGMPPISLISFAACWVTALLYFRKA